MDSPSLKGYLEVLGIKRDANTTQIKWAYHQLALKYHPDKNPSNQDASKFQTVLEAYEIVISASRKAKQDATDRLNRIQAAQKAREGPQPASKASESSPRRASSTQAAPKQNEAKPFTNWETRYSDPESSSTHWFRPGGAGTAR
jgi:DnaJ-class molecular chaperone